MKVQKKPISLKPMKAQKTHQSKPYESTKKPISLKHMKAQPKKKTISLKHMKAQKNPSV